MGMEDMNPEFQDNLASSAQPTQGMDYEPTVTTTTTETKTEDVQDLLNQSYLDALPTAPQETDKSTEQDHQHRDDPQDVSKQENLDTTAKTEESSPVSEYGSIQAHLAQNPYDAAAWNKLIDFVEQSGDLAKVKQAYESLLQAYPNTAEAQIAYLDHYLQPGLFPNAEALFSRFLRPSPSVALWKFYLTYVRRMNADPSTREMVSKAYDFALLYIGQDKDSGEIWREYIDFVRGGETHTTWEEQQKMDALRRIYQKAVQIPLENLEQLWSEYNGFEIGLNKITARKFISDQSKAYMTAKEVLKQLRSHLAILFPPPANVSTSTGRKPFNLPEPSSPHSEGHRMLAKSWRAYLQWEEKNPLDIEDTTVLNTRLLATYKKAVVRMRFNPETWFMAYTWAEKNSKPEEALSFLKSGLAANPASFLLNFAYSEALENAKNHAEVHTMFTKFIEILHNEIEKVEKTVSPDNSFASNGSSSSTSQSALSPQREFARRRTELGIAWISYMRFARRAEGLKPARTVFGKARKDKYISWEVYEAAASMEYHFTKATDVATRIYETGLKLFGEDAEYVIRYLKFLISINDENNARALFERVIGTFSPEKARPIWETWANYEYNFGDLGAAAKLERRMAEVYQDDLPMRRFAQRHKYSNHDAIAINDLGWPPAGNSGSSNGSVKPENSFSSSNLSSISLGGPSNQKRPGSSPERGKTGIARSDSQDIVPPPQKRPRESTPPPRDRERERRERERDRRDMPPPPSRRRYGSPGWDRSSPPRRGGEGHPRGDWERDGPGYEDNKPPVVPSPTGFFLGSLPFPSTFDGPVFRVDDLMQVFRNATISTPAGPPRPRSPPRGRPPPDYGPYQGPGGGRGGRRY